MQYKLFTVLALSLVFTGCASTNYQQYTDANLKIVQAKASADKARYQALAKVATEGDASTRNMAIMALALSNAQPNTSSQPLESPRDPLLQWASILVPSATQIGLRAFDVATQINASDNNVRLESIRYGAVSNIAIEGIKGAKLPLTDISLTPVPIP